MTIIKFEDYLELNASILTSGEVEPLPGEKPRQIVWASLKYRNGQELVDKDRIYIDDINNRSEIAMKLKQAVRDAQSDTIINEELRKASRSDALMSTEYDLWIQAPSLIVYAFASQNRRFVQNVFSWKIPGEEDEFAKKESVRVSKDGRVFCWYSNYNEENKPISDLPDPHLDKKLFTLHTGRFEKYRSEPEPRRTLIDIDPGNQNGGHSGLP